MQFSISLLELYLTHSLEVLRVTSSISQNTPSLIYILGQQKPVAMLKWSKSEGELQSF